ncbi:phage-shock protein [Neosynechococcus sphagnicola sy1]|uniref:Phage-shock protein n=1 Tax=Neosynechococcus sphagnicola sy1 TaxID=1497020 RepID=A0A098TJB0_9CYAN|nr:PspA/IM30 family protein [Neosynechococcus sphagnicola]KGF72171.1 phage-shock protein [Neosynechococcus sphagnicola sy1]
MGLFDRILRVIRANLNSLISGAEDPEKILEQAVMEMQDQLVQLRQAVAQAIATQKRTERQCAQASTTAQDWYRRAQLALQSGEEALAREALTRRKSYQETATAMQSQLDQQAGVVTKLKQDMRTLESKISEARTKKDLYIARARSAQASEKLYEVMGKVNTGSAISAFERMEEKVLQLEARSEAIAELGTDELEKRFEQLGAADDIDQELAAMKAQIASSPEAAALPAANEPDGHPPGSPG